MYIYDFIFQKFLPIWIPNWRKCNMCKSDTYMYELKLFTSTKNVYNTRNLWLPYINHLNYYIKIICVKFNDKIREVINKMYAIYLIEGEMSNPQSILFCR